MNKPRVKAFCLCGIALSLLIAMTGCYGPRGLQNRYTSSVVQYLHPKNETVVAQPTTPVLSLPLAVGIAFVPERGFSDYRNQGSLMRGGALTENQKQDLLDRISGEFKSLPFIKSIELIPSAYLVPEGGFANLDQIRSMYGIDVIALVSYDQVQNTDQGFLSLTYWTIVGAYLIKGEKNDTNTMMDTAVYHIGSRALLFRAPGMNQLKGSATPVNLSEELRKDSREGLQKATDAMIVNLRNQLEQFKVRVKEKPDAYKIEHRPGYTGGGSFEAPFAIAIAALLGGAILRRRKRQ